MNIMQGLYYSEDHEWVRIDGENAYIGITDYAQTSMGDIVFVELPEIDDAFAAGDNFAVVESVKAASDIYMPVNGTVSGVNEELEDSPELLNDAPYDQHIAVITDFDEDEVKSLMDADAYEAFCDGLDD